MSLKGYFFITFLLLPAACDYSPNEINEDSDEGKDPGFIEMPLEVLIDKVRGGLLGQIIGNLNGMPYEFKFNDEYGNIADYVPALPEGAFTDDDTDIEWVYVYSMQKQNNLFLPPETITDIWKTSFNQRIWCSNGYVRRLMDIGINPPFTGKLALNPWAEFNISGQFICETFGLMCPAMPQSAAKLGLHYTKITIDGEPAQATQLFTTMIAMAYIENDYLKILEAGYAALDPSSKIRTIIDDVRKWHDMYPSDWRETRNRLKEKYTQAGGTMRDGNGYELITGATIAAFLYGQGRFDKSIQTGINFGWDCDNTTATLGTILGTMMGYKKMMSQGWVIVDRYRNTSRDGMPMDETITSFADRVFELAEKMIRQNGGRRILREDTYYFEIPREHPGNVESLPMLDNQITELARELSPEIEQELNAPASKEALCRAAYMAICLDLDDEMSEQYPDQWAAARSAFEECWKLNQLIFHGGDFPSILRMKEKFLAAGIKPPATPLNLQVIWSDNRICLSQEEVMALNTDKEKN